MYFWASENPTFPAGSQKWGFWAARGFWANTVGPLQTHGRLGQLRSRKSPVGAVCARCWDRGGCLSAFGVLPVFWPLNFSLRRSYLGG
jgi:hypothetical protein